MRVLSVSIKEWRHFQGLSFSIPREAPIVCLVGGNGTGKSQILELIAAAAAQIGLSPGFEAPRGSPFGEPAQFSITFHISPNSLTQFDPTDTQLALIGGTEDCRASWDRTLTITRDAGGNSQITAGGVAPGQSAAFANHVVWCIRSSQAVHYLMLDADRSYPRVSVQPHQLGEVLQTDWEGQKKSRSFVTTRSLYDEWFKYLLGTENRNNNAYAEEVRRARENKKPDPPYVDHLKSYKDSVKKVLKHLLFTGIDSQTYQIKFDTTGVPLSFDALSGGEREIAFLVGQIERFQLRKGLLLVDEPELHLNYDLLRSWISFLRDTVADGQIILATHSN